MLFDANGDLNEQEFWRTLFESRDADIANGTSEAIADEWTRAALDQLGGLNEYEWRLADWKDGKQVRPSEASPPTIRQRERRDGSFDPA